MARRATRVSVSTAPVLLASGPDQDFNPDYRDVVYANLGPGTVYLGGPDVTVDSGFPLSLNATIYQDRATTGELLFAVASVDSVVAVLEAGV